LGLPGGENIRIVSFSILPMAGTIGRGSRISPGAGDVIAKRFRPSDSGASNFRSPCTTQVRRLGSKGVGRGAARAGIVPRIGSGVKGGRAIQPPLTMRYGAGAKGPERLAGTAYKTRCAFFFFSFLFFFFLFFFVFFLDFFLLFICFQFLFFFFGFFFFGIRGLSSAALGRDAPAPTFLDQGLADSGCRFVWGDPFWVAGSRYWPGGHHARCRRALTVTNERQAVGPSTAWLCLRAFLCTAPSFGGVGFDFLEFPFAPRTAVLWKISRGPSSPAACASLFGTNNWAPVLYSAWPGLVEMPRGAFPVAFRPSIGGKCPPGHGLMTRRGSRTPGATQQKCAGTLWRGTAC